MLALAVAAVIVQLGVARTVSVGAHGGVVGVVVALVVAGFAVALVFTVIYDGPRSLATLFRRT